MYLFKFANYVEWPAAAFSHAADPIVIGILGSDPLVGSLKQLTRWKKVKGRAFLVRRVSGGDDLRGVHILFIGSSNPANAAAVLATIRDKHVLTVSDSPGVFALGSMVNFVVTDQRLRFEVAMRPVSRSGLRLSALLLTAAHQVKRDEP